MGCETKERPCKPSVCRSLLSSARPEFPSRATNDGFSAHPPSPAGLPQTAREEPSVGGRPAAREPGTKARHQGTHRIACSSLALVGVPGWMDGWVRLSAASHSHGQPEAGPPRRHIIVSIHPRLVAGSEGPSQARPVSRCRAGPCCPWPSSSDGGGPMGGGKGVCYRTPHCSVSAASSRG